MRNPEIHVPHLKHRARAQQLHVDRGRQRARNDQRDKRSRLELEQQQLNRQDDAGNRRVECRRHARRRSACQQHLPLNRRRVQHLAYQRSDRSPGLDDRPLRAKRAARANRDRRRNRFQQRDLRLNPAAVDQHRFHRFRNPVPFDLRRAIFRHDANDEPAHHRNQDHPRAQMMRSHAAECRRPLMEEEKIGEQPDQFVENIGDEPGNQSNRRRQKRHQHNPELRRRWGRKRRHRRSRYRHILNFLRHRLLSIVAHK